MLGSQAAHAPHDREERDHRIAMQAETLIWNPIMRQSLVNAPHRMNRREGTTACPSACRNSGYRACPGQTQIRGLLGSAVGIVDQ